DRAALVEDVRLTRERGFCISDQDVTLGVAAVAVPVPGDDELLAALSVAGRREDIVGREDSLADSLAATARKLVSPLQD
ncbi:MAG TPA: IclR family transcriptional regulator C-terminal domain-containing protein, partial [Naasia sp.]